MNYYIEIHRNGINAHFNTYSYYIFDYQSKIVVADNINTYEVALKKAENYASSLYKDYKIIRMW